jgi:hypothetical protein
MAEKFEEQRPRTPRGEVLHRERLNQQSVAQLMEIEVEHIFVEKLEQKFGLKPGQPQFEKALEVWRSRRSAGA